jgi:hypothetical protein
MLSTPKFSIGPRRTVAALTALSSIVAVQAHANDTVTPPPQESETLHYVIVSASRMQKSVVELTNSVSIVDELVLEQVCRRNPFSSSSTVSKSIPAARAMSAIFSASSM